jgi:antitoxin (DNA-binding transcriptional repressor) of toxin-antitoxin stability system
MRGEQIRVTVRGRPVADLVPAGARRGEERLRELVAEGRLTPAARARPRRSPRPLDTGRSASELVLATWDLRLHRAARDQGLAVLPARG